MDINSGKQMWTVVGGVVVVVLVTAGMLALVSKADMSNKKDAAQMIAPTRAVSLAPVATSTPIAQVTPASNAEVETKLNQLDKDAFNLNPTDTQLDINQ